MQGIIVMRKRHFHQPLISSQLAAVPFQNPNDRHIFAFNDISLSQALRQFVVLLELSLPATTL